MERLVNRLDKWHKTKPGLLTFGMVELALAYAFVSLAIDRGSPWWYLLALLFLVGGVHNFVRLIGKTRNGGH